MNVAVSTRIPPVRTTVAHLEIVVTGTRMMLSGELDLSTRDQLEQAGQHLVWHATRSPDCDAVVDAAGLYFVDAAGLGALVWLSGTLRAAGVSMRIPHPSPQLRRLTELCQLSETLGLAPMAQLDGCSICEALRYDEDAEQTSDTRLPLTLGADAEPC